jgi:hypothetical protein
MSQQESTAMPSWLNRVMSGLLRSPLHGLVSRTIMLITFTGRKSGKVYTTPISYTRQGDLVTAFTRSGWWRNLDRGAHVTLRIKNKEFQGWATAEAKDRQAIAEGLRDFLRSVRFDARVYQVNFDEDGQPNWEDVQRAADKVIMIRVKLNGGNDS